MEKLNTQERPSWDKYFIDMLPLIASRSTCLRRQVGAILVKDRRILATGFNGPPPDLPHCSELGGCLREKLGIKSGQRDEICRAVHAEQNAIIQCAIYGISTVGATLYCNFFPCTICTKMILAAKISRCVYTDHYPSMLSADLFKQARNFELIKFKEE